MPPGILLPTLTGFIPILHGLLFPSLRHQIEHFKVAPSIAGDHRRREFYTKTSAVTQHFYAAFALFRRLPVLCVLVRFVYYARLQSVLEKKRKRGKGKGTGKRRKLDEGWLTHCYGFFQLCVMLLPSPSKQTRVRTISSVLECSATPILTTKVSYHKVFQLPFDSPHGPCPDRKGIHAGDAPSPSPVEKRMKRKKKKSSVRATA